MAQKKSLGGRPRRYKGEMETRALHLPKKFWALLARHKGSRTDAFIAALGDDRKVEAMRRILDVGDDSQA